ncbi:MAG: hypothetical protein QM479_12475 [Pseudomonadota bacterium]
MNNGFIDLRQNDGKLVDDSFWPSFTDIMTVIVMIFLIATTVLIVKNWELVRELEQRILNEKEISAALKETIVEKNRTHDELLASIKAKQQISRELEASIIALQKTSEIAEQNQAENETLEDQLDRAEVNLKLLKLQLLKAKDEILISDEKIKNKAQSIERQLQHITNLEQQLQQSLTNINNKKQSLQIRIKEIERLESLLKQSRSRTANAQQQLDSTNIQLQQIHKDLNKSQQQLVNKQVQIQQHLTSIKTWDQKFVELMARFFKVEKQLKEKETLHIQAKNIIAEKQQLLQQKDRHIASLNKSSKTRMLTIETSKKALISLNEKYRQVQYDLQGQIRKLTQLDQVNIDKQQQIDSMQEQILLAQQQQEKQNQTFEQLQEKYKKLIRPARSTLGKHVVEVRYEKINNHDDVSFKNIADKNFTKLKLASVHKKLFKLKQQYGSNLYVKVIIPENSGLSYNEAWQFMQDIFNKYDYYYQNDPKQ